MCIHLDTNQQGIWKMEKIICRMINLGMMMFKGVDLTVPTMTYLMGDFHIQGIPRWWPLAWIKHTDDHRKFPFSLQ